MAEKPIVLVILILVIKYCFGFRISCFGFRAFSFNKADPMNSELALRTRFSTAKQTGFSLPAGQLLSGFR